MLSGAGPIGDLGMTLTRLCICFLLSFLPSVSVCHDCPGGLAVRVEPQASSTGSDRNLDACTELGRVSPVVAVLANAS